MLLLNKRLTFLILFFISGCSPKGLILINKEINEGVPVRIAVLDFHNHSSTSNPRLGRELAERLSYNIFAHSKGGIEVVERNYIKSSLDKMNLRFSDTFSKEDLLSLADSLDVDFLVKGTVINYTTDIMEKRKNALEALISLISSKDGSTIAMLKIRKETKDHQTLVESLSGEAGEKIVREKARLHNLLKPVIPDTSNVQ